MATKNVKSYGAACDLVTDDLPAITAAYADARNGDTINVPAPGCRVATPIGFGDATKRDITLAGDGPEATTLLCDYVGLDGDGTAVVAIGSNNAADVFRGYAVRKLTLRNAGTTYVQANSGLGLLHVAGAGVVRDLRIADLDVFTRNRVGLELACEVDGYRIDRVTVGGAPEEAIYLAGPGCHNGVIDRCTLGMQYPTTAISPALAVRSVSGLTVRRTTIYGGWTHSGIALRADGPFIRGVTIDRCVLEGLGVDAIYVGRADDTVIRQSTIRLCTGAAVRVDVALASRNVAVRQNVVDRCAAGILGSAAGGVTLAGLVVAGNGLNECPTGIVIDQLNAGSADVTGNTIRRRADSGTPGLYILNVGGSTVRYGGNRISGYTVNPIDAAAVNLDA